MRGQWLGEYTGGAAGRIMVNIDEVDDHFGVVAYLNPQDKEIPSSIVFLSTENKDTEQVASANVFPIDPRTGNQGKWDEIKHLYPEGVVHSSKALVDISERNGRLYIAADSDEGVLIYCDLTKPKSDGISKIKGQKMTWLEFKKHTSSISKSSLLFRGQREPWSLRTSFHRRGRYRMSEFIGKDVRQLHQRLSAITSHFFDLTVPDQNGAFFNLLQHHGYPTPLLDWSYSPYVASFFAFRDLPIGHNGNNYVRIYVFNNLDWQHNFSQVTNLDPHFPHLSVMEFIAIDNPRQVPQQGVTTVTNLYDIEEYVIQCERETGKTFLQAIDIPSSERDIAMHDLRYMGITAGSMFPSIDGVCEELRERNFDR